MSEESKSRFHIGEELVEMLKDSVIIQGMLTMMVVGAIIFLVCTGRDSPKELWLLGGTIVGYWFRAKNDRQAQKLANQQAQMLAQALKDSMPKG